MSIHAPRFQRNNNPKPPLTVDLSYPQTDTVVCAAAGEIDLGSAALLREQLHTALAQHPQCVVIDLSAVTFFAAVGVGVLEQARTALADGQQLILVGTQRAVVRVLDICDIDYPRYADLSRGLAACNNVAPE